MSLSGVYGEVDSVDESTDEVWSGLHLQVTVLDRYGDKPVNPAASGPQTFQDESSSFP